MVCWIEDQAFVINSTTNMQSIFNITDYATLINRIKQVKPSDKPIWGKMNAGQMLCHCQKPLQVVFGEVQLKRGLIGILFGGMAKRNMAGEKPLKKHANSTQFRGE